MLSTPSMIALMEPASILAYLPGGHTTVGFEVPVKHFGATQKAGDGARQAARVDARRLRFKVAASRRAQAQRRLRLPGTSTSSRPRRPRSAFLGFDYDN